MLKFHTWHKNCSKRFKIKNERVEPGACVKSRWLNDPFLKWCSCSCKETVAFAIAHSSIENVGNA